MQCGSSRGWEPVPLMLEIPPLLQIHIAILVPLLLPCLDLLCHFLCHLSTATNLTSSSSFFLSMTEQNWSLRQSHTMLGASGSLWTMVKTSMMHTRALIDCSLSRWNHAISPCPAFISHLDRAAQNGFVYTVPLLLQYEQHQHHICHACNNWKQWEQQLQ